MTGGAAHPLDSPVWHALTGRQATLARGDGAARRIDPDYGLFAAIADHSPAACAALARLVGPGETIGLFETSPAPPMPGFLVASVATCVQMTAPGPARHTTHTAAVPLGDEDAVEMLALATLTRPGPFFRATHRFGDFVGIRIDGRLAAMAGTRLALDGYREVSGVCTHPDHRGRGCAADLIAAVMQRIRTGGDVPFLTSYADNAGAIALYERLGFAARAHLSLTVLERG